MFQFGHDSSGDLAPVLLQDQLRLLHGELAEELLAAAHALGRRQINQLDRPQRQGHFDCHGV